MLKRSRHPGALRRPLFVALLCSAILLSGFGQGPAHADVTAVSGGAYGYFSDAMALGFHSTQGPTPTVTLPPSGSAGVTASAATGRVTPVYPVFLFTGFTSGPITVSTQGTTGPSGSVTSSTGIQTVTSVSSRGRQELLTAANLSSTCSASETGISGSTAISNGTLYTDSGDNDPQNSVPDHAAVTVPLPANPLPNTTVVGHAHDGGSYENFRYVFNEQIVTPDGSVTVNAGHLYFLGPTVTGDMVIGQSRCGVTGVPDTTAPQTTIASGPSGTISSSSAAFTFSSSEAGSTFECKLDGPGAAAGSFGSCSSPKGYSNLANGSYTFSVRATDVAGNTDATPATGTFTVSRPPPRPPLPPPPPPPPPVPDTTKPQLSLLSLSPARFRAAAIGPSIAARVGTRVSYRLSEPASVRFRVERALPGRRVGGRCVRATRSNRSKRRCTRYSTLGGSFSDRGEQGQNGFTFRGRLRSRALRPGRYRLRAVATDAAENRSSLRRSRGFRIVRR